MLPSFKLFGSIIYLYPLLMGLAWGLAYAVAHRLKPHSFKNLNLILIGIFLCSWVGAKIFFLITSEYINQANFITASNFWLGGGFVFYGGLLSGLSFVLIYSKATHVPIRKYSFLIIPLGIGHAIGRIGCFFAGCCHGTIIEFETVDLHTPIQLIESALVFSITFFAYKRLQEQREIIIFYLLSYSIIRFILEFLRADKIRGEYLGLSSSQIISIGIITVIILLKLVPEIKQDKL